jgi:hypothetical protein
MSVRLCLSSLALCTALVFAGCYSDVPLQRNPPPVNKELVLQLNEAGTGRLGGLLGLNVVSARGRLLRWTEDSISLSMLATVNRLGNETLWQREPVAIPRDAVALIQERRLNAPRTALASAAGAAILWAAIEAMAGRNDAGPGPGPPPPQ